MCSAQELVAEKGFEGDWLVASSVPYPGESKDKSGEQTKVIDIDDEDEKDRDESAKQQLASQGAIKDINDEGENVFIAEPKSNEHDLYKTRTYDISITYDFYYKTPRLWLVGYDEKGVPLTKDQMYEDIISDYADKTVTLEQHPHQGVPCISIHPCKHALVMKHIIDTIAANGGQADVHLAMFVFLKFISSIIPTVEYDFTIDMELGQ